ncbi:MAG: glycosyltransferase 87 family protein [Thermoleophilaceae bacterium]
MDVRAPRAARRVGRLLALAAVLLAGLAASAWADQLPQPPSLTKPPPFHRLTANQAKEIARFDPKVRAEERKRGMMAAFAYLDGPLRWQISFFQGGKERAQVKIDDASGAVLEVWTGWQVPWKMARGYEGQFGGKLNAPYVWLPLCVLFLLPFVDPRRPFRMLHLDLLALLAFGVSHVFFNRGQIDVSVPLVYPVLVYLLVRMLWAGRRRRESSGRVLPVLPVAAVALAVLFLVGFRIALNVADSSVIDVGYASVVGAHRIADGRGLYDGRFAADSEHGDTYGPVNYLLYLPFERAFGFHGKWDDLPSAHAAAIFFDLFTLLGLLVLGRRLRAGPAGTELGVALAFAWAAYPYTTFVLQSNSNDAVVALLVVWGLVAINSPPARGAMAALAGASKLAPAALAPLFIRGRSPTRRGVLLAALAFAVVAAAAFLPFLPDDGVRGLWDRTLGYQAGRNSPFSIWGQYGAWTWLQTIVLVAALGLAVLVAFLPRGHRSTAQVAALAAAVLISLQLGADHWFYLYIPWFAPLVFVALLAAPVASPRVRGAPPVRSPEPEAALVGQ